MGGKQGRSLSPRGSRAECSTRFSRSPSSAFTLIEVLVVVAIIAVLISILLPSLNRARGQAKGVVCLSNLKQIGQGMQMYVMANKDHYPEHSSPSSMSPRKRWPDYMRRQMMSEEVYNCPVLTRAQEIDFAKPWAHSLAKSYGGYGYNFQYLGNSRTGTAKPGWAAPYFAPASAVRVASMTLAVVDTTGSRKGKASNAPGQGGAAVYVVDPPLGSRDIGSQGSRQGDDPAKLWYEGGTDPVSDEGLWRSKPDDRHNGKTSAAFCDGHAEAMAADKLDGRLTDGVPGDNRYYNGLFDHTRR